MIKLIGLSYSPWTQRARWALDACALPYRYSEYLPGLAEPLLRLRMRKWRGPLSVPVLFADGEVIEGSGGIARFAARHAGAAPLHDFARGEPWEALADAACCEGRLRVVQRSLERPEVQREALAVVPRPLRGGFLWLARRVMRDLARKYGALAHEGAMRHALSAARTQLGGGRYLLGRFSYADIALASSLEMVQPLHSPGPHTAEAWRWAELAEEFADLLAWRHRLRSELPRRD